MINYLDGFYYGMDKTKHPGKKDCLTTASGLKTSRTSGKVEVSSVKKYTDIIILFIFAPYSIKYEIRIQGRG